MWYDYSGIEHAAKESFCCPRCSKKSSTSVELIDIAGTRGVFALSCSRCGATSVITTNIRGLDNKKRRHKKNITKVNTKKIGPDDVVNMKLFLEKSSGEFSLDS